MTAGLEEDIFDLYDFEGKEERKEKEPPSKIRSVLGAFPKGVEKELTRESFAIRDLMEKLPFGLGDIIEKANIGLESEGPVYEERLQQIEERLPTREGFLEKSLERGGKIAPYVALGPEVGALEGLLRSLGAGTLGQGAEELGFGPIGQAIAELPAFAASFGKRIPAEGEELAEFARSMGLTEEDLALTLGDRGIIKDLATETAAKGGRVARAFEGTRERLGRVWNTLRASPEAQLTLTGEQSSNLFNKISDKLAKLPSELRNKIQTDFNDLVGSKMRLDDVVDFWQDLNYYIRKGDAGLGVLKEELSNSINKVSPEFGKDFRLTNQLYGNFAELASKMHPDLAEHLIQAGERGMLLAGIAEGNFPLIKKVLGVVGGRQLAAELVKNPRMQRLVSRFGNAINRNKLAIASTVKEQMAIEIGKSNAEAGRMISEIDVDELLNAIHEEN